MARLVVLLAATAAATPLDDYVSKPSPHYRWHDTGAKIDTKFGGVGHVLNVTSQQWLDSSRAATVRDPQNGGPTDIWTHQVVVIVPKKVKHRMPMKITDIIAEVTKKPVAPNRKYLVLEVMLQDDDCEEVDLPYVRLRLF